jgi:trehalose 6-phosphate phosphatase
MNEHDSNGSSATTPTPLKAVLFDLDGVVTDTAQAHAAAWKRLFDELLRARAQEGGDEFRPFDPEREYREFVDGKPRHAGIRSFLRSRGIDLPGGSPEDPPDAETVFGLGRRKQNYFRAWLKDNRVRPYPGTLKLVNDLRKIGIKTTVFSSSRNAEDVLRNAGVLDLFDAKVDGKDLEELRLRGKPDPAMLHEAAARLGVKPEDAAIVEDAISGVAAGARGGFALVIGVDRGDYGNSLKESGAHIVVEDLSELIVSADRGITIKTIAGLPAVWDCEREVRARLLRRPLAVFLDYDGTLTPIVEDHTKAFLADDMRAAIAGLAKSCTVAVVSGRDLAMLDRLIGLESVYLAGSHGFEIVGPCSSLDALDKGTAFLPELDAIDAALRAKLAPIPGHSVERKRFSVAVHYRQVADANVDTVADVIEEVLTEHPRLKLGHGKKVFEFRPGIDWDKGRVVIWLLEQLGLDRSNVVPIYVGDDITDEDAFRALSGRGITVVVRDHESRRTAADYAVADTGEVRRLIDWLAATTAEMTDRREQGDEA